jgi:hypothetical protein
MPQGKGTYGSKVGRPPKKYQEGGNIEPDNSIGAIAAARKSAGELKSIPLSPLPTEAEFPSVNAMDRSEVSPDVTEYNEGGKVEKKRGSNVLDITRNIAQRERYSKKRQGVGDETYKPQREYYDKASKKAVAEFSWGKKGKKK